MEEQRATSSQGNQMENIKVAVRLRPFTEKEKQRKQRRIVDMEQNTVALYNPKQHQTNDWKRFTFDHSYWSHDGFLKDSQGVNVPDLSHPNGQKYVGQEEVFGDLGQFLLKNALEGYNSALLAYGQTGSGKSYTVSGYGQNEGILPRFARALFQELEAKVVTSNKEQEEELTTTTIRYEVFFSMLEIYNEVVRDLLAKSAATGDRRGLKVREHPKRGFFVESLSSHPCADKSEIERLIEEGQLNKSIAATSMNETSSRGHTIYEFRIRQFRRRRRMRPQEHNKAEVVTNSESGSPEMEMELELESEAPEETVTSSMVQLVDLAGSERLAVHVSGALGGDSFIASRSIAPVAAEKLMRQRNKVTGSASSASTSTSSAATAAAAAAAVQVHETSQHQRRFKESVSINQSLSALGNCIQVMSQYSQQMENNNNPTSTSRKAPLKIPYRDSVLTKLLNRCCLSGNSKVAIIATLSPVEANYDDTLSTLRFADRAKQIKTHATINRDEIDRREAMHLARLRQLTSEARRITRSDDSSQTSNFDENENMMENFTGSRISSKLDTMASPLRSRTTVRRSKAKGPERQSSSSSNPTHLVREQMRRLVSPSLDVGHKTMRLSRSHGYGLSSLHLGDEEEEEEEEEEMDEEMKEEANSPESEDSSSTNLMDENLSSEDKIGMVNMMLNNSLLGSNSQRDATGESKLPRPKRGQPANLSRRKSRAIGLKQVNELSSNLKRLHPYLSNLNMDEQLSGMISYIIKQGETVFGKANGCDVVLRGTELRGHHAKISRSVKVEDSRETNEVYIEPVFDSPDQNVQMVALRVNGELVLARRQLQHGDRVLFGTNSYYVYLDEKQQSSATDSGAPINSLISFDAARNEVLDKMMADEKNEAMIKEINDYTHRPGTGKGSRAKVAADETTRKTKKATGAAKPLRLARSMSIYDKSDHLAESNEANKQKETETIGKTETNSELNSQNNNNNNKEEDSYREQLMMDTYEFAIPVAEVVAVAKEMGVRVNYELKILTGEEQLPAMQPLSSSASSNYGHENSGSSSASESESGRLTTSNNITYLNKLDGLDLAPAVFVRVHLEELDIDFHWSKEKFQARRFKILELYAAWEVGGKAGLVEHLIEQWRHSPEYLIDPFVDDPATAQVLIGHAQIVLQPISHLADLNQSYDVLNLHDETVGSINVIAIPCHYHHQGDKKEFGDDSEPFREFNQQELDKSLLANPRDLLGKRLVFKLKLMTCQELPANRYTNVFCQYLLNQGQSSPIRTKVVSLDGAESSSQVLTFDHSHYICFERVTEDILEFFEHGFLTIQVVGQYRLAGGAERRAPTLVTTIVNSINKYKDKLERAATYSAERSATGQDYSSDQSNSDRQVALINHKQGHQNSQSGPSSVASTSNTVNLFDQQTNDDDENNIHGLSQENIIDMILTKRKLDRAENQLHFLKQTVNMAEHYNKKHIPLKTVKRLLNSYGHELDNGSVEELDGGVDMKNRTIKGGKSKNSTCTIQ